jgi:hypothetical protein
VAAGAVAVAIPADARTTVAKNVRERTALQARRARRSAMPVHVMNASECGEDHFDFRGFGTAHAFNIERRGDNQRLP